MDIDLCSRLPVENFGLLRPRQRALIYCLTRVRGRLQITFPNNYDLPPPLCPKRMKWLLKQEQRDAHFRL